MFSSKPVIRRCETHKEEHHPTVTPSVLDGEVEFGEDASGRVTEWAAEAAVEEGGVAPNCGDDRALLPRCSTRWKTERPEEAAVEKVVCLPWRTHPILSGWIEDNLKHLGQGKRGRALLLVGPPSQREDAMGSTVRRACVYVDKVW